MRVAMLSKALVVAAYRRKCALISARTGGLTALVPPAWGAQRLEPAPALGYDLRIIPIWFNGSFHTHFFPTLGRELRQWAGGMPVGEARVVHLDEEPYNLATVLGLRAARAIGARTLFFTWQNLNRRYPPPFRWFERYVFKGADGAIAGNAEAAAVLRAKGYRGATWVIPQFGVDAAWLDSRAEPTPHARGSGHFVVGFAGRLVPEKGVDVLLNALAGEPAMHARIAGDGPQRGALEAQARQLGISQRVEFVDSMPSGSMPGFYAGLDALALPSRTLPNWKEQFGRVLVEAMALGVPVAGSDSGEIPRVIADAGLLFAEGDAAALRAQLHRLLVDRSLHASLSARGRQHVAMHYTMDRIAEATVHAYHALTESARIGAE